MDRRKQYRDQYFINKVAEQFSEVCKEEGITHERLSELTGFDTRQIGRILRGESNISISQFVQVCRALKKHPSDILKGINISL